MKKDHLICSVCGHRHEKPIVTETGELCCPVCACTGFLKKRIMVCRDMLIEDAQSEVSHADTMLEDAKRRLELAVKRLTFLESDRYVPSEADYIETEPMGYFDIVDFDGSSNFPELL